MYCPNCYRINDDTNKFCVKCGHPLHEETDKVPEIAEEPKVNLCTNCGKELSGDTQQSFCPYCGHRINGANKTERDTVVQRPESAMKYCTHCGKAVKAEAVVCIHCGCPVGNISPTATTQSVEDKTTPEDEPDGCAGCMCFLFPPLGVIAYFILLGSRPNTAKNSLKMAGYGILVGFLGTIFTAILG